MACGSQELTLGVGAKFFLIGWPILFVSAYLVTLAVAGITVPGVRRWGAVIADLGFISTIVAVISNLRGTQAATWRSSVMPGCWISREKSATTLSPSAHPHEAWAVAPCAALEPIRLAVEIINQLWH